MCPMLDSTSKSAPRKFLIVRAFAGDSTMTRRLDIRTRVAEAPRCALDVEALADVPISGNRLVPARLRALPARDARPRPTAARRLRPGRQPRVELGSVAARDAAASETEGAVHGQVGAVLVAVVARPGRGRGVQGSARRARH